MRNLQAWNYRTGVRDRCFGKDESTLVFQKVPAEICTNCGEEYISSLINATLLSLAREELNKGVTLEVLRYAA